jgi:hypothetical protein
VRRSDRYRRDPASAWSDHLHGHGSGERRAPSRQLGLDLGGGLLQGSEKAAPQSVRGHPARVRGHVERCERFPASVVQRNGEGPHPGFELLIHERPPTPVHLREIAPEVLFVRERLRCELRSVDAADSCARSPDTAATSPPTTPCSSCSTSASATLLTKKARAGRPGGHSHGWKDALNQFAVFFPGRLDLT